MERLSKHQQAKLNLLRTSMASSVHRNEDDSALCASLRREERLQYHFLFIYQLLMLIFSIALLSLLGVAVWRIIAGNSVEALVAGAGALVSGTASGFLVRQRSDARDAHVAAKVWLEEHRC